MSIRVKVYGLLLTLVLIVAGGYFLKQKLSGGVVKAAGQNAAAQKGQEKKEEATPVQLAVATRGEISSAIRATGNLRALREVVVTTQAEGIVQQVLKEEGDYAADDELVARLDDTQLKIRLELAREKLAQAKLQMEKARIREEKARVLIENNQVEWERYQKAHQEGLVSEKEVAAYKYKLDELSHDQRVSSSETREFSHRVAELEAEIAQAELEIARTQIRAPFAGYLTQRTVEPGQRVRALDPMFRLGAFSPLYVDVFLSEREAREVRPGQFARVRLGVDTDEQVPARVARISPVVDQATGTVKVTVEVRAKAAAFRPGAFVRVDVRTDTRNDGILIPKKAVLEQDGDKYVFIAEGTTARRSRVSLGYENEEMVEIRAGVAPGQKVVVAGQGALKEGATIKTVQS
jgi:membrane fusion protein (multidrug efflux system)